jgi:mRNA interferase RelE/StbE
VKTAFKSSFAKDLKSIKSKAALESVAKLIEAVEAAGDLRAVPDLKKLKAAKVKGECYRIRLGNYRVGITLHRDMVTFVRCLSRKDIYRYFP